MSLAIIDTKNGYKGFLDAAKATTNGDLDIVMKNLKETPQYYEVLQKRFREYSIQPDMYLLSDIKNGWLNKEFSIHGMDLRVNDIVREFSDQFNFYNIHAQFKKKKQKKLLTLFRNLIGLPELPSTILYEVFSLITVFDILSESLELEIDEKLFCERYKITKEIFEMVADNMCGYLTLKNLKTMCLLLQNKECI